MKYKCIKDMKYNFSDKIGFAKDKEYTVFDAGTENAFMIDDFNDDNFFNQTFDDQQKTPEEFIKEYFEEVVQTYLTPEMISLLYKYPLAQFKDKNGDIAINDDGMVSIKGNIRCTISLDPRCNTFYWERIEDRESPYNGVKL